MSPILKKYCSVFLLGVFLFAYSEKNLHDILHADDVHCMAHSEKHFHNQEHHCFICDFNLSFHDNATFVCAPSFTQFADRAIFVIAETGYLNSFHSLSSNRGPPTLA